MKKGLLLLLLCSSVFVKAQSLKEALFSGKLKNEPGTVIRKGDDLSTKIDTTTRKIQVDTIDAKLVRPVMPAATATVQAKDTAANTVSSQAVPAPTAGPEKKEVTNAAVAGGVVATEAAVSQEATVAPATGTTEPVAKPTDNNSVLKGFMDSLVSTLKTDVLPSKKVKEGSYLVLVSYAIQTDGQLDFTDVFVSPENNFLQDQIKQRLAIDVPHLQPELTSTGKPRKVNKKYKFTVNKQ
ncbi:MAG TPA: hypothetical protein VFL47_03770 [Flavisolibacter sp.]|nr:hypothetical protein [Flavisolibacter sp.]